MKIRFRAKKSPLLYPTISTLSNYVFYVDLRPLERVLKNKENGANPKFVALFVQILEQIEKKYHFSYMLKFKIFLLLPLGKKVPFFDRSLTLSPLINFKLILGSKKENFKPFYLTAIRALQLNSFRSYIELKLKFKKNLFVNRLR